MVRQPGFGEIALVVRDGHDETGSAIADERGRDSGAGYAGGPSSRPGRRAIRCASSVNQRLLRQHPLHKLVGISMIRSASEGSRTPGTIAMALRSMPSMPNAESGQTSKAAIPMGPRPWFERPNRTAPAARASVLHPRDSSLGGCRCLWPSAHVGTRSGRDWFPPPMRTGFRRRGSSIWLRYLCR
jgi:hypothetical protein